MSAVLDHVFVCTAVGAPAASRLAQLGLTEGTPNRHPGQGTACRRFFFRNFMLELLWVEDVVEAQSPSEGRRMRLWERWSAAGPGTSPFGIILRPDAESFRDCPFPSWEYRPTLMPDLVLQIAADGGLDEPLWCFMPKGRAPAEVQVERRQPLKHRAGFHEITGVRLVCPPLKETSVTSRMAKEKVISLDMGPQHAMELEFDQGLSGGSVDLRPELPLSVRW